MNGAHLHLIVSHLPVLGVAFAAVLLGTGLWRKNRTLQLTAFSLLALGGVAAAIAFLTGEGAEEAVERTLAAESFVEPHEEAALAGLIAAAVTGLAALWALFSGRKGRSLPRAVAVLNLLLALTTSGILAWVANLGGQIGHPEIRNGQMAGNGEEHEH